MFGVRVSIWLIPVTSATMHFLNKISVKPTSVQLYRNSDVLFLRSQRVNNPDSYPIKSCSKSHRITDEKEQNIHIKYKQRPTNFTRSHTYQATWHIKIPASCPQKSRPLHKRVFIIWEKTDRSAICRNCILQAATVRPLSIINVRDIVTSTPVITRDKYPSHKIRDICKCVHEASDHQKIFVHLQVIDVW